MSKSALRIDFSEETLSPATTETIMIVMSS